MCRGRYLLQVLKLERLLEQRTWRSAVYTSAGRRGNCQTFEWAAVVNGRRPNGDVRPIPDSDRTDVGAQYPTMPMILLAFITMLHNTQGGLDILRDVLLAAIDNKFVNVFDDEEMCVTPSSIFD